MRTDAWFQIIIIIIIIIIVFSKWWISSIWSLNGTLAGTIITGQRGPETNGNEGVLHISKSIGLDTLPHVLFNVLPRTRAGNTADINIYCVVKKVKQDSMHKWYH